MPNWTFNKLVLSHDNHKKIKKVKKACEQDKLFSVLIPVPKKVEGETPNILSKNEYDWRYKNWGVSGDARSICIDHDSNHKLIIRFDTPYEMPFNAYKKLEDMGFTITAWSYSEGSETIHNYYDNELVEYDVCSMTRQEINETYDVPFDILDSICYDDPEQQDDEE